MKGNGKAVSFPLGRVLATPGALDRYGLQQLAQHFARHARGDWGDLDAHDRAANKGALQHRRAHLLVLSHAGRREALDHHRSRSQLDDSLLPGEY